MTLSVETTLSRARVLRMSNTPTHHFNMHIYAPFWPNTSGPLSRVNIRADSTLRPTCSFTGWLVGWLAGWLVLFKSDRNQVLSRDCSVCTSLCVFHVVNVVLQCWHLATLIVDLGHSLSQRVHRHMLTWYPVMVIRSGVDS